MNKVYVLTRMEETPDKKGVFGYIEDPKTGKRLCATYELPYKDNKKNVSSIPLGRYKVKIRFSPTNGRVFELDNVDNRSYIQIHVGNDYNDTKGCILVGTQFKDSTITNSRYAMGKLLLDLPDEFELIVCHSPMFEF